MAREIRDGAGLTERAEFVCCDGREADDHLDRQFDVVFASDGVLCWVPDLEAWIEIPAALCKPGATLVVADGHPVLEVFDWDLEVSEDGSYFREEPLRYDEQGTYADRDATVEHSMAYEWQHGLGEVVTAVADAGFRIDVLREYPTATYQGFGSMEEVNDGEYRLPGDPLPTTYALAATRE